MKILHTGDWHIGPFPGPEKDGVNLREQDTYGCLEAMIDTAKEVSPDVAVICGDIFHTAKVWSNRALQESNNAREYIEALSEICPVVVLYGTPNHDLKEQFIMLESYFDDNPRVIISMHPQRYVLQDIGPDKSKLQVCTLPGFDRGVYRAKFPGLSREEENQVFTEELNNIVLGLKAQCDSSTPSVFISHYTVPGCNMESGQSTFFSLAEPVILPETLNAASFDLVALGHIHRPQQVAGCPSTFYAGAISTFNFNDEGQERGFYIHTLSPNYQIMEWELTDSAFFATPYREFITVHMNDNDITSFNSGKSHAIYTCFKFGDEVQDSIVRVVYSCTEENNKMLNKALLEKELYAAGAFWVSEIVPVDVTESIVKSEFVDDNTPVDNLRDYITGKQFDEHKVAAIITAALPIIDEAIAGSNVSRFTGIFEPESIEVSNYRNYETESFDFSDITFCTINGTNGAGKSSLFMDAILDCLYEEPREGDLTGWIRNNEDAKSGSITFSFKLGDKTFRVARTRTKKSGKATLNISELVDGEWLNRSKEKMRDTQDEIVNILGMDSLTFRSCALIMQDQYGIFLQSDKEDRMTVLANLLGLGIYEDMEALAKNRLSEVNSQIRAIKTSIERLSESVAGKETIEANLAGENERAAQTQDTLSKLTADRDAVQLRLSTKLEAAERAMKQKGDIEALNRKKEATESAIKTQGDIIENANVVLSQEPEILAGVAGYHALLEDEKSFISSKSTYEVKQKEQRTNADLMVASERSIADAVAEKTSLEAKRQPLVEQVSQEAELAAVSTQYQAEKQRLAELEKGAAQYIELSTRIEKGEKARNGLQTAYSAELSHRITTYKGYQAKAELLEDAGCIDVANAKCKFLSDAQAAKAAMDDYQKKCTEWKEVQLAEIQKLQSNIDSLTEERDALGYNPQSLLDQKTTMVNLELRHTQYEKLGATKEQLQLIDDRLAVISASLLEAEKTLTEAQREATNIENELVTLSAAATEYDALKLKIMVGSKWLEKEKLLPVAREQLATAEKRVNELALEVSDIEAEALSKQQQYDAEAHMAAGAEDLQNEVNSMNATLETMNATLNKTNMQIGALQQQLTDIEKITVEALELQARANGLADSAVIYDALKTAFSQDGIPHNIIRSIIPLLASKANSILGQMTGGRMGLEFVTDKVMKSNKKEVVTLDILIEEYGKGKLPYLSKSGGEKVKAALSAILALAEIKTTRSGIQLGMLFIDEPPFLDSYGMQAYCDALEAIQQRYCSIKIMAITHDPAMKARFPQSLDVVKTDNGSKVISG